MQKLNHIKEIENLRDEINQSRDASKPCIIVSGGTCGNAKGSVKVLNTIKDELKTRGLDKKVNIRSTGCLGYCEKEPIVQIEPEQVLYVEVKPKDIPQIIEETIMNKKVINKLCYSDFKNEKSISHKKDIPFYKKQQPIVFGNNISIDPTSIEDYIAIGGYSALTKVLTDHNPEQVIDIIKKSGLRGRGGGGFLTGRKWESCRNAEQEKKYVIINADEGDPGAYMDRALLEGNPHSVLEGAMIGAFAIGSNEGYIYVRMEYPLATKYFRKAIEDARNLGLLGDNILGTDFSFNIKINQGGGAFVCGESTALMASIEGRPGEPRAKHVHTVERGLWDRPTTLNNVETWSNVPLIINKGADWFSKIGTEKSKGTKIFSLVGKVKNNGLIEVPMGLSLREIIFDIGGGIKEDKKFKGVQTGGPSGGIVPEKFLDLPVDFDQLLEIGSMMGSGGMIVMDEDNCMVDFARYFINFLKDESCGKCTPCREGLVQIHHILDDMCNGKGKFEDLEKLDELAWLLSETSLCQLGASAANPVLTTLKYFREEFEAHIKRKECPAKSCKKLIQYEIDTERCTGCVLCKKNCPAEAIEGEPKIPHLIDTEKCTKCGICMDVCPQKFDAVVVKTGVYQEAEGAVS